MYQMTKMRQSSMTGVQPYRMDTAAEISTYWW